MLLAIDIGNTNITLGVFKTNPSKPGRTRLSSSLEPWQPQLAASWRLSTRTHATADEYGTKILDLLHYAMIERAQITAVAVANVVPSLAPVFDELSQKYFSLKPWVIGANARASMPNLYENPREVGADRIVNAVAAYTRFGGPCIVVDFGTATTFDCITRKGEYAGGVIVPGPTLSAESLALHTAKLPKVEMAKPQRTIGRTTVESIQSGLYYGYLALVDGLIDRLQSELGKNVKVAATGGLATLIAGDSRHIHKENVLPDLTLQGICLLYEKNQTPRP